MTTAPPPNEVLATETRRFIEMHTDWDAPHQFATVHWDGQAIAYGTLVVIDPAIDPRDYPQIMAAGTREQAQRAGLPPLCAIILQMEANGVQAPRPDALIEERSAFAQRRLTSPRFSDWPEAWEAAEAWCADTYGSLWHASKRRDNPSVIKEEFFPSGRTGGPGGRLIDGLLRAARVPIG